MKAMVLNKTASLAENPQPLELTELPDPVAGDNEVLLKVRTCGVCHTELDEIEGRLQPPRFPLVLGHQVVGEVLQAGKKVTLHRPGDRVGVGWIDSACGHCRYCLEGNENLCAEFRATGYDNNGGYAEKMVVDERFAYALPGSLSDIHTAPLLCAGAIGYRSLRLTELKNGEPLGLTGFGASAHLVLQMASHLFPDSPIYVFARNPEEREFALQLGAAWAGDTTEFPTLLLDAIIDTTPVWFPVVSALERLAPGGRLVINAIRKEDVDKDALLQLDYPNHLWREKEIKSVANVARNDVIDFLKLAAELNIQPEVERYTLEDANRALVELKNKHVRGAKVLVIDETGRQGNG
ncbi:MAG: zinc-dependent alcohol dehydrogenase family protein [Gammaproteobacteria bacterium]|nr:zinc-dependent alcohol dehydrogenase family protein [Gammaproteobacteria bacterium]